MKTSTDTRLFSSKGSEVKLDPGLWSVSPAKPPAEIGAYCDSRGEHFVVEAAAETFALVLKNCYAAQTAVNTTDRISLTEQYFSFLGMGTIEIQCSGDGASVTVWPADDALGICGQRSEKWSRLVIEGYIKAACAAVMGHVSYQKVLVIKMRSPNEDSSTLIFHASWQV